MSENPTSSGLPASAELAPAQPRSGVVPRWWLLLLALLALALVAWQWYDARNRIGALQEELARRLAEGAASNKEASAAVSEARTQVRALTAKVEALENGLAESQNQQVALEALYQQLSRGNDDLSQRTQ